MSSTSDKGLYDTDDMESLRTLAETWPCDCGHGRDEHLDPELSTNRVTGCLVCDCVRFDRRAGGGQ